MPRLATVAASLEIDVVDLELTATHNESFGTLRGRASTGNQATVLAVVSRVGVRVV